MSKAKATRTFIETKAHFIKRMRKLVDPKLWKKYDLEDTE